MHDIVVSYGLACGLLASLVQNFKWLLTTQLMRLLLAADEVANDTNIKCIVHATHKPKIIKGGGTQQRTVMV